MREVEKRIQEKRTIEATKKKLMGFNGKLGCIVRNLGQPIISQSEGGTMHEYGPSLSFEFFEEDFNLEEVNNANELIQKLPTMQVLDNMGNPIQEPESKEWGNLKDRTNYTVGQIGWHFDGLSRGMHLEIKYEESGKKLSVHYQGYEVYKESSGELLGYSPNDNWEDKIEQLYKVSKKIEESSKKVHQEKEMDEAKFLKNKWWEKTKEKWGL
jgi:hypothetical protein